MAKHYDWFILFASGRFTTSPALKIVICTGLFPCRHFGVGAQPIRHKPKLGSRNFPVADTVKQMVEKARRQILPANPRHI